MLPQSEVFEDEILSGPENTDYPTEEMPGATRSLSTAADSREALYADPEIGEAFLQAKRRVRLMELRYVEESDPLRQTLLEIYVAIILKTPYNAFDTR